MNSIKVGLGVGACGSPSEYTALSKSGPASESQGWVSLVTATSWAKPLSMPSSRA